MVQAERIEEYLRSRLPQATEIAVQNVQRLPGGASRETWSFDARWREGGADVSRPFVLRRDPDASLLETDRDIEFRVMEAVWSQGVPVPRMYWLGAGTGWVGGAGIHALDWRSLGLECLAPPTDAAACGITEIERWEAVVDRDALEPQPVLRAAFRWLRRNLPPPAQRIVLVHADYRTGNFLCAPDGQIKGILDWELTHLGDPLEDVAWACIRPYRLL